MKVTILGNNSALPAYDRHPTAQVVTIDGEELLLDCGEGTQIQMQRYNVRRGKINHIFISHLHGDHYFGIFGLLTSMSLLGRTNALHLYAPAPLEELIKGVLAVANGIMAFPFYFHALPEEGHGLLVDEKLFSVSCFPTEHRIACYGFVIERKTRGRKLLPDKCAEYHIPAYFYSRITQGEDYERQDGMIIKNEWVTTDGPSPKKYAYCADTIATESFLPYIMNADTIYHESTYQNDNIEKALNRYHSTAQQAAELAVKANAKQLLLGHYSSNYRELHGFQAEAEVVFPNTICTIEGNAYEI